MTNKEEAGSHLQNEVKIFCIVKDSFDVLEFTRLNKLFVVVFEPIGVFKFKDFNGGPLTCECFAFSGRPVSRGRRL